jgi:cytoskeletal protein CcmA (bactofilin family)
VSPSLVIVDGDLDAAGNPVAYGVIYVRGDLVVNGTLRVFGSLIVEGQVTGNGNVDVYYDSLVIQGVSMDVAAAHIVPGTWRDWRED